MVGLVPTTWTVAMAMIGCKAATAKAWTARYDLRQQPKRHPLRLPRKLAVTRWQRHPRRSDGNDILEGEASDNPSRGPTTVRQIGTKVPVQRQFPTGSVGVINLRRAA